MSASVVGYLGILILGGLMGVIGQGVRSIVGLKKMFDSAETAQVGQYDLFMASRLFVSLFIGFVAGASAALFTVQLDPDGTITPAMLMALAMAGYAGADFIEGIAGRFTKSQSAPANDTVALLQENLAQLKFATNIVAKVEGAQKAGQQTISDVLTLLSDAYVACLQELRTAPPEVAVHLREAKTLLRWVQDELGEQQLHSSAETLSKLTDELEDTTGKLKDLKKTLQDIQAAAGVAANLLNMIAKIIPLL